MVFDVATPVSYPYPSLKSEASGPCQAGFVLDLEVMGIKKYSQVTQDTEQHEFWDLNCTAPGTVFSEQICHFRFPLSASDPQVALEMEQLLLWGSSRVCLQFHVALFLRDCPRITVAWLGQY